MEPELAGVTEGAPPHGWRDSPYASLQISLAIRFVTTWRLAQKTSTGARALQDLARQNSGAMPAATRTTLPHLATIAAVLVAAAGSPSAFGHAGGLNSEGCHTNRKTGDYHCHGAGRGTSTVQASDDGAAAPQPLKSRDLQATPAATPRNLPPGCYIGPRGGTYTITKSGRKNYGGC